MSQFSEATAINSNDYVIILQDGANKKIKASLVGAGGENAGSYVEESDCLRVNKKLTHEESEMVSSVMENLIQQAEKLSN